MTYPDDEELSLRDEIALTIRCFIGILLIYFGIPFIWLACKFFEVTPVNFDQLWYLLRRNDGERRNSKYGLELILSFDRYLNEDHNIPMTCYRCDFSKDSAIGRMNVHCVHPDAYPEHQRRALSSDGVPPEDCPIRLRLKLREAEHGH